MSDFKQYEDTIALYNSNLKSKSTPINSWDFHNNFLNNVKNYFYDLNKIELIALQNKWSNNEWDIKNSLKEEVIIVTDVKLKIVFASYNIIDMNGYTSEEVVGKSPRMFQGEATNKVTSNEIRIALQEVKSFEKTIINYKKNGETYECLIKGYPIFDNKGILSHYIAFEKAA
ncbi:PAS domain S-box-containing protein [Flavobacterium sp. PL11]|jgi:PAS domain S-box-containing protein|uniref:PAS domain-containing protein n=1 Tax=Flavobacterium sp. PL11 TaxID=3071717 RepID=UPI002E099A4D|nr:PAS domain S-box-containing protein [Flavobacterium sp. PL11]